jgi:hypothetical protein
MMIHKATITFDREQRYASVLHRIRVSAMSRGEVSSGAVQQRFPGRFYVGFLAPSDFESRLLNGRRQTKIRAPKPVAS